MDRLIIDRNVWERGSQCPLLLSDDDALPRKQCCVGIYLTALGVPDDMLRGIETATDLEEAGNVPEEASWLVEQGLVGPNPSGVADALYEANDRIFFKEEGELGRLEQIREEKIAQLFEEGAGIAVEFVG